MLNNYKCSLIILKSLISMLPLNLQCGTTTSHKQQEAIMCGIDKKVSI